MAKQELVYVRWAKRLYKNWITIRFSDGTERVMLEETALRLGFISCRLDG
jgi:hypothetical protein